jgi:hypothetical protein
MREILPSRLWLGNAADLREPERILRNGIQAVVEVAIEQWIASLPRTLIYCRFPIVDGEQDSMTPLRAAMETTLRLLKSNIPTLVCCGAGMSRSPAVVAGVLTMLQGGSPDDHLRAVVLGYPHDVSPQLWQDVRTICDEMEKR